ncbi:hypothetical protein WJX82_004905 [Trebouxia sp. C0006]
MCGCPLAKGFVKIMCCIAYVLNKLGDDSAIPGAAGDDAPRSSHREDAEDPSYNSPTSSSREGHSEEPLLEPGALRRKDDLRSSGSFAIKA